MYATLESLIGKKDGLVVVQAIPRGSVLYDNKTLITHLQGIKATLPDYQHLLVAFANSSQAKLSLLSLMKTCSEQNTLAVIKGHMQQGELIIDQFQAGEYTYTGEPVEIHPAPKDLSFNPSYFTHQTFADLSKEKIPCQVSVKGVMRGVLRAQHGKLLAHVEQTGRLIPLEIQPLHSAPQEYTKDRTNYRHVESLLLTSSETKYPLEISGIYDPSMRMLYAQHLTLGKIRVDCSVDGFTFKDTSETVQ